MHYEWDEKKNAINQAKHGFPFEDAVYFEWENAITLPDNRKDYGEPRFISTSFIDRRLFILIWTARGDKKRIIGLRKANLREEQRYDSKT